MEDKEEQKTAYYLFQKDRVYRDKTLTSLYFKSNKEQLEKKIKEQKAKLERIKKAYVN